MIPKPSKFPTRVQFLQFRAVAKQSTTPHLRILTSPHTPSRLSVIVPIKVSKRATTRNWLKRLTYDTAFSLLSSKNLNCVVFYKPLQLKKSLIIKQQIIHEFTQAFTNN